jgi:hypothetical protein
MSAISDYYANLLIIQYNELPKAKATMQLLVESLLAEDIVLDVRDAFNLETATGVQLDILGKYIGVDRFFYSDPFSEDYFGFADAVDTGGTPSNIVGFEDAVTYPSKSGEFLDASQIVGTQLQLNDASYRTLLKLKIIQNYSDHSAKSIDEGINLFFENEIRFLDNYDMTITYLVSDVETNLLLAILEKNVLPKPMGVGIQVLSIGDKVFGFADASNLDISLDYIEGFNDATVGLTKDGSFLDAANDIIG